MQINELSLLLKILFGASATFLAILAWSKTTNQSWIFIILGIITQYIKIIFETLQEFGILTEKMYKITGIPIIEIVIENTPIGFFIAGLLVFLLKKKSL